MKRIGSIWVAAALLMLAPALLAQAQANSVAAPSALGAAPSAPSRGETVTAAQTHKPTGNKVAHHKKKTPSFMHKMRGKATRQIHKLFGSKQQPSAKVPVHPRTVPPPASGPV
jgi:hypothetical protein